MATNGKRKRFVAGQVVYSTNPIQNACARALVIMHYYCPLTKKRIKRIVKPED